MSIADRAERLARWFRTQVTDADDVTVSGLDRVELGHSAEMLMLTLVITRGEHVQAQNVVIRMRPPEPGLLEPYDLERQFRILQALEPTAVLAPPALWFEPTGDVLGRPFLVMARVDGEVYEREAPAGAAHDPDLVPRMAMSLIDQLVAVHHADLHATGLHTLGDGRTYLDRELDRWAGEIARVQRGPLPAFDRLHDELRRRQPEPTERVTLVHGDPKPGNFAFRSGEVSAVFDWELTDVGDPLADIGYFEVLWQIPAGLAAHPTAPHIDDLVARYEELSGIAVRHREWYRAFQVYKLGAIQLVGSMLADAGHWNDPRAIGMAVGIQMMTPIGLRDLGLDEDLELGPIFPRPERMEALTQQAGSAAGPSAGSRSSGSG